MSDKSTPFLKLLEIMKTLRAEGGCPWDREQTHESIRSACIEEAYEVVEAIEQKSPSALKEELGDLLLQVVFHAQMADEAGTFSIADIITNLNDKMIRRHPHVFEKESDHGVYTSDDVTLKWASIKKKEGREYILDGLPKALPALQRSHRMGEKLASVGFDWKNSEQVLEKITEELSEISAAESPEHRQEEFGDLLFAMCQWARHEKLDPEMALRASNQKFAQRIRWMEEKLQEVKADLSQRSTLELEALWSQAKDELAKI